MAPSRHNDRAGSAPAAGRGGGDRLRDRQGRPRRAAQARRQAPRRPVTPERGDFVGEGAQAPRCRPAQGQRHALQERQRDARAQPQPGGARQVRRQRARRRAAGPASRRRSCGARSPIAQPHGSGTSGQSDSTAADIPPTVPDSGARGLRRRSSAAIYSDVTMPMHRRESAPRRPHGFDEAIAPKRCIVAAGDRSRGEMARA